MTPQQHRAAIIRDSNTAIHGPEVAQTSTLRDIGLVLCDILELLQRQEIPTHIIPDHEGTT